MKKLCIVIALIATLAIEQKIMGQTGIKITVFPQLTAGTISGGISPLCYNNPGGSFIGTPATGGKGIYTYQWQSSSDGTNWANILGANALTYNVGNLLTTTRFRVACINPLCGTLYSNIITINVYSVFVAGTVTGGNNNICNGANGGTLTATASTGGAPGTTYQWQSSIDSTNWANVFGQTTLTLITGNLTHTMWYRLQCNNSCTILFTNNKKIVVYDVFTQGVISANGDTTICHNIDFGAFVGTPAIGGAPGTTYQWEQTINNGITWANILGANGINYDPANLVLTTKFRRQDQNVCNNLYTNPITILVYPAFTTGIIGNNQSICSGTTPTAMIFTTPPAGGDGIYTYQWRSSPDGGVTIPWNPISGATNNTYQPASLLASVWYSVIVSSGCGSGPALP